MKAEYDFSKARKNPYTTKSKKQITINIDNNTIDYFKSQSEISGIPYQTLINLYLTDCAMKKKQLHVSWNWPPAKNKASGLRGLQTQTPQTVEKVDFQQDIALNW